MKRLLMVFIMAFMSLQFFVACGGSGGGNNVVLPPEDGILIDPDTEKEIKLSFFGKGRASNTDTAIKLFRETAFLYSVQRLNYNNYNNPDAECFYQAFFKPTCASEYNYAGPYGTCLYDSEVWGDNWNPSARDSLCNSYTDNMAVWLEIKDDNTFRIRIAGYNGELDSYSYNNYVYTTQIGQDVPNDSVQSFNNGNSYRLTLRGGTGWTNYNKVLIIEAENLHSDSTSTNVTIKYGTQSNPATLGTFYLQKQKLL